MAVFNKSIEDEIFTLETLTTEQAFFGELETPGNDRAVFVRQPDNGGEATITGLEIGLIKDRLDFLPGPLATLGFSANLTFNSGDFDILDRDGSVLRTVNPEGLSEPITSATLYYEGTGSPPGRPGAMRATRRRLQSRVSLVASRPEM